MDSLPYVKLKKIRESKGITIDVMASLLQIKACTYQAIENGETDVKISRLFQIIALLDCSVQELFCEDKNNFNEDEIVFASRIGYTSFSDKYTGNYLKKLMEENTELKKKKER